MKLVIIIVVIGLTGFISWLFLNPKSDYQTTPEIQLADKSLKVVAVGDISCPDLPVTDSQCQQKSTSELVQKINPELVLALGDLQYGGGSLTDYQNFYNKSWGTLKDKTRPAVGNHEYETPDAQGYFDYFNGIGNQIGPAGDTDKGYFGFEKDGWQFIALNSNCWAVGGCEENSPQGKWLVEELKKSTSKCQLVYFHHPLFSSGLHGPFPPVKPLWEIMYDNQVEVVLNGHDHLYERFALQDANGNPKADGIRQFVVGTGGRNLYQIKNILPNSEIRIDDKFGVLDLELKLQAYIWKFIDINNQVLDSGSASCHFNQTSI